MKFSYQLLKCLVPHIPSPKELEELLTFHSFEIESVEKVGSDYMFDIKILPDRTSDAGNYWGMAQEIAAVAQLSFTDPSEKLMTSNILGKKLSSRELSLAVEDTQVCTRYIGCVIKNVSVAPSTRETVARMKALGQNSINSLVDFANIAMLETGQPLHVFDQDKIVGLRIIVRKAKKGEKILTLDDIEYALDETMTVIADDAGPLAIAGIKGGKRAEVDAKTKNIVVEAAYFNGAAIRKSTRALKFSTDAAQRFMQGIDPNAPMLGATRLVDFITKSTKGKVAGYVEYNPHPQTPRTIALRKEKVESVLGMTIDEKEMVAILQRLGFKVRHMKEPREILLKNAKKLIGKPYKYGASAMYDAPDAFDCSSLMVYLFRSIGSQIPRMSYEQYAYGTPVEEKDMLPGDLVFRARGIKEETWRHDVGHVGLYIGGGKIIDASGKKKKVAVRLLKEFKQEARQYFGARRMLSADHQAHYMVTVPTRRTDILLEENLIEEVGRIMGYERIVEAPFQEAFSYQVPSDEVLWRDRIKQFLVSSGFFETDTYDFLGAKDIERFGGNVEKHWELENPVRPELMYLRRSMIPGLSTVVVENYQHDHSLQLFGVGEVFLPERFVKDPIEAEEGRAAGIIWNETKNNDVLLSGKGVVSALLESLGILESEFRDIAEKEYPFLHPHRSAVVSVGKTIIGYVGSLHPIVMQSLGIKKGEAVTFELSLAALYDLAEGEFEYQAPSKYPSIVRDISVIVPKEARIADVENIIENTGGELLWQTELFDLYEGEKLTDDFQSLAFHLIFQSDSRTLRDSEVDEIVGRIIVTLDAEGWEVRR
jgi:phenylalanyl-tRNA synthetase beta subunit